MTLILFFVLCALSFTGGFLLSSYLKRKQTETLNWDDLKKCLGDFRKLLAEKGVHDEWFLKEVKKLLSKPSQPTPSVPESAPESPTFDPPPPYTHIPPPTHKPNWLNKPSRFSIILRGVPIGKEGMLIMFLRELLGLGIIECEEFRKALPKTLVQGVSEERKNKIVEDLQAFGAEFEVSELRPRGDGAGEALLG